MSVKFRDAQRISNKASFPYAWNSVARRFKVFNMHVVNLLNDNFVRVPNNSIVFVFTFGLLICI